MRRALLAWGDVHRRDLPWRRTRDPWKVLVSESMLQQTQVARVVPRYRSFVRLFPTPRRCADAPLADVVRAWAGLGYNRRAVNLHRCARAIVVDHGGALPDDLGALRALPGIGPYTARAVLAFAFERDVGVLDTNAARILARVEGRPLRAAEAQSLADSLVPPGRGWAWNQAMLDLGAACCVKRVPDCGPCPLRASCRWARQGHPAPDPAVGSAAVPRAQSRFEGSDRQGRGRLVDALREHGRLPPSRLAAAAGWPHDPVRARRVADDLVADGLAVPTARGGLELPR